MTGLGAHDKSLSALSGIEICGPNRKVSLPLLEPYPTQLRELLTGSTTDSRNFHNNIRQYTSTFSFASFGAQMIQVSGK